MKLNQPSEFIIWISGHKSYNNSHGEYGRFSSHDKEFNFELGQDRQFGGFHGTADTTVKSIGVYVNPSTSLNNNNINNVVEVEGESWENVE